MLCLTQKTAYEKRLSIVGSEMCIEDRRSKQPPPQEQPQQQEHSGVWLGPEPPCLVNRGFSRSGRRCSWRRGRTRSGHPRVRSF